MAELNRRQFLAASGAAAFALSLAACSGGSSQPSGNGTLRWWDHFNSLQDLNKATLAKFSAGKNGIPTKYTFYQLAGFAQALQLAKRSGGQPDIHSLGGITTPLPLLIDSGWFQPLHLSDDVLGRFGKNDLVDGVHRFDGKLYSFPLFSERQHNGSLWYRKDLLDKIGAEPPKTFDEFRSICSRANKAGSGVSGWVAGLNAPNPYLLVINALAQAAGFPGDDGLDYHTGEVRYEDDAYLQVFELFDSLRKDKLMFAGATSSTAIAARGRWAAGQGVFFFDGPYMVGSISRDFPGTIDGMGLAGLIGSQAGSTPHAYRPVNQGPFYMAKSSKLAGPGNQLLGLFSTPEYYAGLAAAMDQPPRDLSIVAKSDKAHPLYKAVIAEYAKEVFIGPSAIVGNAAVARVDAETKPVPAKVGDLFRGVMSGQISDYRSALAKLSGQVMSAREAGIKAAKAKGADVNAQDWAFANWKPGADYTVAMYGQR